MKEAMTQVNGSSDHRNGYDYSILDETHRAVRTLLKLAGSQIPEEIHPLIEKVEFSTANNGLPYFPCPFKETEAMAALKAMEAGVALALANLRFGERDRKAHVDLERASCFLFSAYVSTVDGMSKQDPNVKSKLKDTDLLQAQSIQYRRLSANLYETRNPGEYYHLHGSLEATTSLNMIGLEGHRPDMTDYRECIDLIESHMKKYSLEELEEMNAARKQAGVIAFKWEDFQRTKHGQTIISQPPWSIDTVETSSPLAPFPTMSDGETKPQVLTGIRVLELCRIIAGPAMGRGLAEYGADVIKVTSPKLSDVPFFQVDGSMGKHATDLDLRDPKDRQTFEALFQTADVVLDGYRPGSLERLGYGPKQILELRKHNDHGIVYVSEDCFGYVGEWAGRPGWQQIADCVTGVAWAQGQFMGLDEPVVPPFPMSDYGTGCMGTIAALTGLYKRARYGGSYWGKVSLVQYDVYLLRLGLYPEHIQEQLRKEHDEKFFELRHADSVDEVGKRALASMRRTHPELFQDKFFHESWSRGFKAPVKYVRPVVEIEGLRNGFSRSSRPNGFDEPTWDGWEVEESMVNA